MKQVVIGVGSPFGGDQAGWLVVDLLRDVEPNHIDLIQTDRPGLTLLELMKGYQRVVLVDAIRCQSERIMRLNVDDLLSGQSVLSSHNAGVVEAVSLGQQLGDLPDQLEMVGVGIVESDQCPSAELIQQAAMLIRQLLNQHPV